MKKNMAIVFVLLIFSMIISGCASSFDKENKISLSKLKVDQSKGYIWDEYDNKHVLKNVFKTKNNIFDNVKGVIHTMATLYIQRDENALVYKEGNRFIFLYADDKKEEELPGGKLKICFALKASFKKSDFVKDENGYVVFTNIKTSQEKVCLNYDKKRSEDNSRTGAVASVLLF